MNHMLVPLKGVLRGERLSEIMSLFLLFSSLLAFLWKRQPMKPSRSTVRGVTGSRINIQASSEKKALFHDMNVRTNHFSCLSTIRRLGWADLRNQSHRCGPTFPLNIEAHHKKSEETGSGFVASSRVNKRMGYLQKVINASKSSVSKSLGGGESH